MRIQGRTVRQQFVLIAAFEALAFFFIPHLAALLRFRESTADIEQEHGPLWPRGVIFAAAMVLCLFCVGQYSARQRARAGGQLARVAVSCTGAFVGFASACFVLPREYLGRGVLGLMILLAFAICLLIRGLTAQVASRDLFKCRVLVYGSGTRAMRLTQLRRRTDRIGFVVVGFIPVEGENTAIPADRLVARSGTLLELCLQNEIDDIVIAMEDRRAGYPVQELLQCRLHGIRAVDLEAFFEQETGRVPLDLIRPSWLILGDGFHRGPLRRLSIRIFDIVASVMILLFAWPVMMFTVLAIKVEDGICAPVLYRQTRVGLGGAHFEVLKFRSMHLDAEQGGTVRWAQKRDRRVTRVGSIARPIRLDELPQLFNVLSGDMSFVGPRPERPEFVEKLCKSIPYYDGRHITKPGITGWAQLCYPYGSSEQDAVQKLQYDLYYIKNRSLLFDLSIVLQTVEVIMWRKGAR